MRASTPPVPRADSGVGLVAGQVPPTTGSTACLLLRATFRPSPGSQQFLSRRPALLDLPQPRICTRGRLTSRVSPSSRSARESGDVEPHHLLGGCPA